SRAERAAIGLAYALSIVPGGGGAPVAALGVGLLVLVVSAQRYARVSGPERRARATALAAAALLAAVLLVSAVTRLAGSGPATNTGVLWAYQVVVAVIAAAVAVDLVRGRWVEATVTGLVVDLGEPVEGGVLRRRLAGALGDPTLVVGYRLGAPDRYVDERGREVTLPAEDGDRRITFVREGGEPVAALVHTVDALAQPELVQSVAAAARIAVANARLQADVQRQIAELEESRRRIVEAADTERRRLERELREGAERTLGEIETLLGEAPGGGGSVAETLAEIRGRVQRARGELREFARGMHPRSLTDGGPARALRELVAASRVPVALTVTEDRFPQQVEAAAYFVCSEALANVEKYASAANVAIDVVRQNDTLVVTVSDDGGGGAAIGAGSGLRGLADRVEALGGQLEITSPLGGGTRVVAELPLG
ncbi:MAG TPA: ATP-binding protein, partial [Gaiellaceae bacterium]|nr:ATP-binding protein [Gaiellaceae bacterium]